MCIEIFHRIGDKVWLSFIHIQLGIPSYSTIFSLFQIRRFPSLYFQIRPLRIDPVKASAMVWYENYATGPQVGFRVEVHDAGYKNENNSFRSDEGSMVARNPRRGLDENAFRDHLPHASGARRYFELVERRPRMESIHAKTRTDTCATCRTPCALC